MMRSSLVSQSVIDASDTYLADLETKINANPKLKKIYDDAVKEAQDNIDRHKKMRLKRKIDGTVVEVEVGKKPVSRSVKLARDRAKSKRKLILENDSILRALALMRDGQCVVCHTTIGLQTSHIYCKGKYPHMRWLLDNVEMRCAGDHKFKKGSPHGDPAGFALWLIHLPLKRMVGLHEQAARLDVKVTPDFINDWNEYLREEYWRTSGNVWGE